jgi:hypothetical protein
LGIIIFKKMKIEKKKMKIGGGWSYPHGRSRVAGPPTWAWGWSGHPKRPKKKKKKKKTKNGFWTFGGGQTTPKGLGVASATPYDLYGVAEATLSP